MNDELESRLRSAFRSDGLPVAPATLLDALDVVVAEPVRPGSASRGGAGRRSWGVLAVAAVLLVGGAVALSVGNRTPDPAPSPPPTVSAAPTAGTGTRLTFEPQWTFDTPFNIDDLTGIVGITQARIDSSGVVGVVVSTDEEKRVVVDIPLDIDSDPLRSIIGRVGNVAFVPLGGTIPDVGATIDLASFPPLFGGSAVEEASVVPGQTGDAGLELALNEEASALFADYTAKHIGEAFAITIDGVVAAAPVIQAEVPGGEVRIEFGLDRPKASDLEALASVIRNGPLPVALVEVASGPAPSAQAMAAPAIHCEAPLDVEGPQLDCDTAVRAALAILPAGHPVIAEVTFVHECNDVRQPGVALDCFVQAFGVVTVTFVDSSPPVRIGLSLGTPPFIIPPLPTPSG